MPRKSLFCICDRVAEGFKKALRKDASIRCSIPSSKTPGLNLVRGSALKKSRCFPVTLEGTRSLRAAWAIPNRDFMKRMVFDPAKSMWSCCRRVDRILTKTSSRGHATKLFEVNGQYSMVLAFCLPLKQLFNASLTFPSCHPSSFPPGRCTRSSVHSMNWLRLLDLGPWSLMNLYPCSRAAWCKVVFFSELGNTFQMRICIPPILSNMWFRAISATRAWFPQSKRTQWPSFAQVQNGRHDTLFLSCFHCSRWVVLHCCVRKVRGDFRGDAHQVTSSLRIDLCSKICHQVWKCVGKNYLPKQSQMTMKYDSAVRQWRGERVGGCTCCGCGWEGYKKTLSMNAT